jgi:hypothetical protein
MGIGNLDLEKFRFSAEYSSVPLFQHSSLLSAICTAPLWREIKAWSFPRNAGSSMGQACPALRGILY